MFKKGEVCRCADAGCGCEISVAQDAKRAQSDPEHRCCCGMEMRLKS